MEISQHPAHPTQDTNHLFVQPIHTHQSLSSLLGYQIDWPAIMVLVFKELLFYLIMAPKCKSRDAKETSGHKAWEDD